MDGDDIALTCMGLFSIVAAFFDWDWFMNDRKARFFGNILEDARVHGFFMLFLVCCSLGLQRAVFWARCPNKMRLINEVFFSTP